MTIRLAQSTIGHVPDKSGPGEPTELPAILDQVAAKGYDGVEIWEPHLAQQDLVAIRQHLDRLHLAVPLVSSYFNFTKSAEKATESLAQAHRVIDETRAIGGSAIRVFTGGDRSADASPEQWDRCVACLQELADAGAPDGIELWLHTHDWNLVDTVDGCRRLLDRVARDNVGLLFKPSYFFPRYVWDLECLADAIRGVQVTVDGADDLEQGRIDYTGIMALLARQDHPVWYCFTWMKAGAHRAGAEAQPVLAGYRAAVLAGDAPC